MEELSCQLAVALYARVRYYNGTPELPHGSGDCTARRSPACDDHLDVDHWFVHVL